MAVVGADGSDVRTATEAPAGSRLEQLTREILQMCGRATGLETTYLTLIHRDLDLQEILYSRNVGVLEIPEGLRVDWSDTLCRRALEGEGPSVTDAVPEVYGDSAAAATLGLQTYVSVPVQRDGEAVGTLCGASTARVTVSEDARRLMASLAEMVAMQLSLEDASGALEAEVAELDRMANTDALTGLANRRHLDGTVARHRAARDESTLSVLVLDLDRFKAINDTHGHLVGDEALQHVAEQLRAVCRTGDTVARSGGDEFVVLLPDTAADAARTIAIRLREAMATTAAATGVGAVPVRVSVGTATGRRGDVDRLLGEADADLYRAKASRP